MTTFRGLLTLVDVLLQIFSDRKLLRKLFVDSNVQNNCHRRVSQTVSVFWRFEPQFISEWKSIEVYLVWSVDLQKYLQTSALFGVTHEGTSVIHKSITQKNCHNGLTRLAFRYFRLFVFKKHSISYHGRRVTWIPEPSTNKQAFFECLFGFADVDFKYFQFASDSRTPFHMPSSPCR